MSPIPDPRTGRITTNIPALRSPRLRFPNTVVVSLEDKSATVRFDPTVLKLDELREAVEDCGFDVLDASSSDAPPSAPTAPTPPVTPSPTPSELPPAEIDFGSPRIITLAISGMSCRRCVDWVTQALRSVEGVSDATVDLSKHVATVEGVAGAAALVRRVSDTGYTARVIRSNKMTARGSTPTRVLDLEAPDDDEDSPLVNATGGASDGIRSPDRGERSVTLRVSGMSCASCVAKVEEAAMTVPGVASATVNLLAETATVRLARDARLDAPPADPEDVAAAVASYGYAAEVIDTSGLAFRVGGMVCASCPPRIEMAIGRVKGVARVEANYLLGKVVVQYNAAVVGARMIKAAIEALDYTAELWDASSDGASASDGSSAGHAREASRYRQEFFWSICFARPLLVLMMGLENIPEVHEAMMTDVLGGAAPGMLPVMALVAWIAATPVQFWLGRQFYIRSGKALRHGSANMDLLVAMGTSAAYAYSVYVVLVGMFDPVLARRGGAQFFETAAVLISFVLLGKWLEARAKGKTSEAIRKLASLQPSTATIVEVHGEGVTSPDDDFADVAAPAFQSLAAAVSAAGPENEREVDTALLQRGDVASVFPGAHFPADGIVLCGKTAADESMITGESMPVSKSPGDGVIGGTVNRSGMVLVLARGVGADSMLSKVVRLIEDAQVAKAPIQAYADKVSAVFVPAIVVIATVTWVTWFSLASAGALPSKWTDVEGEFLFSFLFAITVLVIACPCALGLATPTAVMVGTGLGARMGILIKGGAPLETAHAVSYVVFDKTGTLTKGQPAVTAVRAFDAIRADEDRLLWLAGSAETGSEHPIGRAIVTAASSGRKLSMIQDFEAVAGRGLRCRLVEDGSSVLVGNVRFMSENGVDMTPAMLEAVREEEEKGQTVAVVHAGVAQGGKPLGLVCVSDPVRPEASAAVAALTARGIGTSLVSGDNWRVARAIAASVGIRHVVAEALPAGKVDAVRDLQREGNKVAVVGDGINDAPAMAQSDLGIAVGAGTDVAMEAAGVVLVRSNLLDVVAALDISRVTFRRIRINLFFSLAYNCLGVPIAAGALYPVIHARLPPEVAALAMALSSVSVVMSSLSLRYYQPPIGSHRSEVLEPASAVLIEMNHL